jgi:protein-S-isoprenylcysteine O-methyltransferase Ste14
MRRRHSYRIPIGFLVGIIYLWIADPSPLSFTIGAVCMVCGEAVRILSAGTLAKYEGVTQTGIYTFTRNPLYIGSFIIGTGACVMGRNLVFSIIFYFLFFSFYLLTIRKEERFLIKKYGEEYRRYCAEVPRFIPNQFNLRTILDTVTISRAITNGEHLTVLGILCVWIIIAIKMMW